MQAVNRETCSSYLGPQKGMQTIVKLASLTLGLAKLHGRMLVLVSNGLQCGFVLFFYRYPLQLYLFGPVATCNYSSKLSA